ncbi:hypothetical protein DF19_07265 [Streptomyces olindensis]|nr:hypothetical protein DF19_07265 [Streptomyces olindensis]
MRKIPALFATLTLAGLGALVPTTSAQAASAACDNAWNGAASGWLYAYKNIHCSGGVLGRDASNDENWGDGRGELRYVANQASSLVHKGTSGMAVKVYDGTNYTGASACLAKSELYVSDLTDDHLVGGGPGSGRITANDTISSHKWVWESACGGAFLR